MTLPRRRGDDHVRRSRGARRLIEAAAVVVSAALLLSGCTGAPQPTPTPSPTHSTPDATGEPPAPPPTNVRARTYAEAELESMSTAEKAASVLMLHAPGTDPQGLADFVSTYEPGGMILMGDNMPGSLTKLRALTDAIASSSRLPVLTAVDQEGGIVRRVQADTTPGASQLRAEAPDATKAAFSQRASTLTDAGFDINFGIIADTTNDKDSFIYDRVLGTTPSDASDRVIAAVRGERGTVASTLKHFPGHGGVTGDSHTSLPTTNMSFEEWRRSEMPPFRAGSNAGADFLMVGHLIYSAVDSAPASLSARWHEIARDDLGFDGIIITDDMLMLRGSGIDAYADAARNAVTALAAGNDMLLYVLPSDPDSVDASPQRLVDAIVDAVSNGDLDEARLDDAAVRILTLRREVALAKS